MATDSKTASDETAVDTDVFGGATVDEYREQRWGMEGSFSGKKEIISLFSCLHPPPEVP